MPNVIGAIREKWLSLGGPQGLLGAPLTDELPCADGKGRYNQFAGGCIFWHPKTGAHEVHGDIFLKWKAERFEQGRLGYPTSDEHDFQGGRRNKFQRGYIHWTPKRGAVVHMGQLIDDD